MSTDERSLADEAPEVTTDLSEPSERGSLDVDEFLAGVRALRRQVWIRPNLHLFSDLERLVDEIEAAPEDADVDSLIDEYEETKARFEQRERWVVEQRSHERRRHVRREAAKALDVQLADDGESVVDDDANATKANAVEAYVMADHVVAPEGVTAAHLEGIFQSSPSEANVIASAVVRVQRVMDETVASEVLRDFSSRRSAKTKGSTKR